MNKLSKYIIYFLLFVPPLIFFTDATRNPYYFQIFLLNVLVLLLWLIYLIKALKQGKIAWAESPVDLPLFCFIGLSFLTTAIAFLARQDYLIPGIVEYGKKLADFHANFIRASIFSEGLKKFIFTTVNVLLSFLIPSIIVFTSTNRQEREAFIAKSYNILFTVGLIASVYGILQYFGIEFVWANVLNPFGGRPVSTFGNPNFMSSYLVILFPLILSFYLSKVSVFKKIIYLIMLVFYFSCILATLTRSSWVGLFVAIGGIALYLLVNYFANRKASVFSREKKWAYLIMVPMLVFFLFWPKSFGGPTPLSRIIEIKHAKNESYGPLHQRILIWSCAWSMVKEKPVLGKGWGLFELFYPFYQGRALFNSLYASFRTHANNAHNEILEYWSQIGTVGLGFYLWFLVTFFTYGLYVYKNTEEDKKILIVAIMSGTMGMIFDNIFGNVSTQFCTPAFLYWWNMGTLVALDSTRKTREFHIKGIRKIPVILASILFIWIIYVWYNYYAGEASYFAGFKMSKKGNIIEAKEYLEKAHKYNREVNSEYELGNCYARMGNKDKAIKSYYDSLAANFGYDEIHFNLATVLSQYNDIDNAYENYTMCLNINPLSFESYIAMETLFLRNREKFFERAVPLFEQAVYLYPKVMDFWNNLGYVYTQKNQLKEAAEAYRRALYIDPEFEQGRQNLKSALAKLGVIHDPLLEYPSRISVVEQNISSNQWQKVINSCLEIIEKYPNSYRAHFYMGNAYFSLANYDNAISAYNSSLSLKPQDANARLNLGISYLRKDNYAKARESFNKVLELDPPNKTALEQLKLMDSAGLQ